MDNLITGSPGTTPCTGASQVPLCSGITSGCGGVQTTLGGVRLLDTIKTRETKITAVGLMHPKSCMAHCGEMAPPHLDGHQWGEGVKNRQNEAIYSTSILIN